MIIYLTFFENKENINNLRGYVIISVITSIVGRCKSLSNEVWYRY